MDKVHAVQLMAGTLREAYVEQQITFCFYPRVILCIFSFSIKIKLKTNLPISYDFLNYYFKFYTIVGYRW